MVDSGGEADLELVEHIQISEEQDHLNANESITSDDSFIEELEAVKPKLPHHLRCCSHTLSLIATTDFMKILKKKNAAFKVHETVIAKCTILWNAGRRPKSAEIVRNHIECQLVYPCPTRWNSLFDSIKQILKHKSKVNDLLENIAVNIFFKNIDFEYLEEYCVAMMPLATALDGLQGQNENFYGQLFPTLYSLKTRLDNLIIDKKLRILKLVIPEVLKCFEERFSFYFDLSPKVNNALIAAAVHPYFKLRWITCPDMLEKIKKKVINLCIDATEIIKRNEIESDSNFSSTADEETPTDVYVFNTQLSRATNKKKNNLEVEILNFWDDISVNIEVLNKYPNIKKMFIKYNTNLCSSAPVERLFSFAGFMHSPNRGSLSDKNFEMLVFLKGNENFCSILKQ